jgi:hypothetical protein
MAGPAQSKEQIRDEVVVIRSVLLVLLIAIAVGGTATACTGCPAALLEGVLTEQGGDLVVTRQDGGAESVNWSASGHRVSDDGGVLVVTDGLGFVKARQGEFVRLGGGEIESGLWKICGMFDSGAERLSPDPVPTPAGASR